jgi:hypothetical protein
LERILMSMDRSDLERARQVFVQTASEIESSVSLSASQLRSRLRSAANSVLEMLGDEEEDAGDDEDVMSSLDRQSRSIAEELRRVERLMRQRTGDEE